MVVTVIFNALLTVRTTCVAYNLENVLHVNLDGQENLVLQVWSIINLCLKSLRISMQSTFKNPVSNFQNAFKWISIYGNRTILKYVQNNDL